MTITKEDIKFAGRICFCSKFIP